MKLSINAAPVIRLVVDGLFLFSMWYAVYYGMHPIADNFFTFIGLIFIVAAISINVSAKEARIFYSRPVWSRYWDYLVWGVFVWFNVWIGHVFVAFVLFLLFFSVFIIAEDKAEKMWAEDDPANSPGS